ncbi:MAG: Transporter, CPA2 family [Proteiniphilum acetatigenes]|jgi:hypothetical protein|uniref:Transporter, CPA2 family n=1 Tax=Proteiniphilum acetatigenes TaxID=294710 RepID=A0A101HG30_9BACT|nr:MAG: Transporter, CPA2 family [Proteiniphilum acetatigenes]
MEFVDRLLKRFDGDAGLKKPTSALVCFSSPKTGKKMAQLIFQVAMTRSEGSSITLLYFMNRREEDLPEEEIAMLQSKISTDFMPKREKEKITLRTFISDEADHMAQIGKMIDELGCNLLVRGIRNEELNIRQVEHYSRLRRDPANPLPAILAQFPEEESMILQELSAMMENNRIPTALFVDNGMQQASRIFLPLLCKSDIHLFTYLYHLVQQEQTEIMLWDAIGIIKTEPKLQKIYQFIEKKSDGKLDLWNNDRKIDETFIREQDLMMIGVEGWSRLTNTPLLWKEQLPSLLIIKDNNL